MPTGWLCISRECQHWYVKYKNTIDNQNSRWTCGEQDVLNSFVWLVRVCLFSRLSTGYSFTRLPVLLACNDFFKAQHLRYKGACFVYLICLLAIFVRNLANTHDTHGTGQLPWCKTKWHGCSQPCVASNNCAGGSEPQTLFLKLVCNRALLVPVHCTFFPAHLQTFHVEKLF